MKRGRFSTVYGFTYKPRSAAFYNANIVYFITKQATLIRRSIILSLPL
jgi:hypothetical protein